MEEVLSAYTNITKCKYNKSNPHGKSEQKRMFSMVTPPAWGSVLVDSTVFFHMFVQEMVHINNNREQHHVHIKVSVPKEIAQLISRQLGTPYPRRVLRKDQAMTSETRRTLHRTRSTPTTHRWKVPPPALDFLFGSHWYLTFFFSHIVRSSTKDIPCFIAHDECAVGLPVLQNHILHHQWMVFPPEILLKITMYCDIQTICCVLRRLNKTTWHTVHSITQHQWLELFLRDHCFRFEEDVLCQNLRYLNQLLFGKKQKLLATCHLL